MSRLGLYLSTGECAGLLPDSRGLQDLVFGRGIGILMGILAHPPLLNCLQLQLAPLLPPPALTSRKAAHRNSFWSILL